MSIIHSPFVELLKALVRLSTALQSPIEYQKERSGSQSLTRNSSSGGRMGQSSSRPSSTVSLGAEKPSLSGRSSTPIKLTTSSSGPCHDSDRYHRVRLDNTAPLLALNTCTLESSQVTFIYIALLTIQIGSKQLHNIKIGTFLS